MTNPDVDLLARVVYEEWARMHPRDLQRAHWVMDADMLRFIRELRDSHDQRLIWESLTPDLPLTLLGHPVEIQDGAEGVRLVAA